MKNNIYAQVSTRENKNAYKTITSKQWQVYYYLLSISKYNAQKREQHRYVYKNSFTISGASNFLGIGRATFYRAIDILKDRHLIQVESDHYKIYAKDYVSVNTDTLQSLLKLSKNNNKNVDLLRLYLCLKRLDEFANKAEERCFTKRDMISILGHNVHATEEYENIRNYIAALVFFQLIEIKTHTETHDVLGGYTVYHLQKVNEISNNADLCSDLEAEMIGSRMPQYVYDAVRFVLPEFD